MKSKVKDMSLASAGRLNIEWAKREMKALLAVKERFAKEKPLKGLRIGMALHITKETAVLVETLTAGGAEVWIAGCNPLSTQDDIAAALADSGIKVFGWKGQTKDEYYSNINAIIDGKPNITIDDGCDLVTEIHLKRKDALKDIIGGTEETTTGVIRLRAMEKGNALKYPVVAVNDNKTKHLIDNYYGTGQSAVDGIIRATNVLFAGKNVVVVGYGSCGKGVALRAKGLGANVIVTEVNAFSALQAKLDGYSVMTIGEACRHGDMFITVTGNKHVIGVKHFEIMKDGAILANAGHFDLEIDVAGLEKIADKKKIRQSLDEYTLKNGKHIGKKLYVCAEGRLVNLAAAEGHPSAVMSLSFCGQALAVEYIVKNKPKPGVIVLPEEIDNEIAKLAIDALGVRIDELTPEQKQYLGSWTHGT